MCYGGTLTTNGQLVQIWLTWSLALLNTCLSTDVAQLCQGCWPWHPTHDGDPGGTWDQRRLSVPITGGFSILDAGKANTPPILSAATCCAPLNYDTPVTNMSVVAGFRYDITLHAIQPPLSTNSSLARLLLVHGTAYSDLDCDDALMPPEFLGTYSALDGTVPASLVTNTTNSWQEARSPCAGVFGGCYMNDTGLPQASWHAVHNVTFNVFGAPCQRTPFFCMAEQNASCILSVPLLMPRARLMLLEPGSICGTSASPPQQQPFSQTKSTPVSFSQGAALHSLGEYVASGNRPNTYSGSGHTCSSKA